MSASSKKKLRNEQEAVKLTERQLAEQKEAKKLKAYTATFVAVVAALLVIALVIGVNQIISTNGIREKNTVAMTVGEHKISNAELSYYYIDSINNFYSQYGSYASLFGLDTTKPLDEQNYMGSEEGETWADYFIDSAKSSIQSVYALVDAANAAGHTISDSDALTLENAVSTATLYASIYGYADVDTYLKTMYGTGASVEGYRDYVEKSLLADSYYSAYADTLTYEDADLRAREAENFDKYSAFSYNYYQFYTSDYLEGGTTDENGNTTYSDEENAVAAAKAKEAAEAVAAGTYLSVDEFDAAVDAAKEGAVSYSYDDQSYSSISGAVIDWLSADERQAGDVAALKNASTSTDADGNETTSITGYYVVYFRGADDNTFALKNVRHTLVAFEGGTTDENGATVYSDEEKAAAKTAAEELLAQWQSGEATEDSFAAMANEHSDDGDGTTGGLYTDIYPGQMVASFEDWCFDAARVIGDTGIIESDYGYHIMYFVGNSDITYRDYLIEQELINEDVTNWYTALIEAAPVADGNASYVNTGMILG